MEIIYSAIGLAYFVGWFVFICFCCWGAITIWKEWVPKAFKAALLSFVIWLFTLFLVAYILGPIIMWIYIFGSLLYWLASGYEE